MGETRAGLRWLHGAGSTEGEGSGQQVPREGGVLRRVRAILGTAS